MFNQSINRMEKRKSFEIENDFRFFSFDSERTLIICFFSPSFLCDVQMFTIDADRSNYDDDNDGSSY